MHPGYLLTILLETLCNDKPQPRLLLCRHVMLSWGAQHYRLVPPLVLLDIPLQKRSRLRHRRDRFASGAIRTCTGSVPSRGH